MKGLIHARSARGFSLIEVMIAVVVLSVGLLALAALQANLIRSSSESKAQTVALSLAKDRIEDLRTYVDLDAYRDLTDGADAIADVSGSLGGVDYTRTWTVERFAFNGAVFVAIADTGAAPVNSPTNNEFKRIRVNVSWADANGATQTVAIEDAIGAIDPRDSGRLAKVRETATPRPAEMIIINPASVAGVIPIAIGDSGSDTAATNPRPEVAGKSGKQKVIETRFDILTYAALFGNDALAQSRVETVVVGCQCDLSKGGANLPPGRRPTYWDGERYAVPDFAVSGPPAGQAVLGTNDPPNSTRCTICCRDHHDPDPTITSPKFDPRRTSHDHYVAGGLLPVTSGVYQEACRIIRVDGFFRVSADMYNDKFGLLATKSNATLPVPSDAAVTGYQGFVLDYLRDRVTLASSNGYNTRTPIVPYADATNDPASIDINAVADFKWLHSRGLYMDYLETEAIARIDRAKTECADRTPLPCTPDETHTAVLKLLPFTSINVSELADWRPSAGRVPPDNTRDIVVSNALLPGLVASDDPERGKVTPGSSPTDGATPVASSSIFESNSGVALLLKATDPVENAAPLTDTQPFRVVGSSSGGGTFQVFFDGYTFALSTGAYPQVFSNPGAVCDPTNAPTYACLAGSVDIDRVLTIRRYNYQANVDSTDPIDCYDNGGGNGRLWTPSGPEDYVTKICRNFEITQITPPAGSTVLNEGTTAETTELSMFIAGGQTITLTFGTPVNTIQPLTCRYTAGTQGGNTVYTYTVSSPDCP